MATASKNTTKKKNEEQDLQKELASLFSGAGKAVATGAQQVAKKANSTLWKPTPKANNSTTVNTNVPEEKRPSIILSPQQAAENMFAKDPQKAASTFEKLGNILPTKLPNIIKDAAGNIQTIQVSDNTPAGRVRKQNADPVAQALAAFRNGNATVEEVYKTMNQGGKTGGWYDFEPSKEMQGLLSLKNVQENINNTSRTLWDVFGDIQKTNETLSEKNKKLGEMQGKAAEKIADIYSTKPFTLMGNVFDVVEKAKQDNERSIIDNPAYGSLRDDVVTNAQNTLKQLQSDQDRRRADAVEKSEVFFNHDYDQNMIGFGEDPEDLRRWIYNGGMYDDDYDTVMERLNPQQQEDLRKALDDVLAAASGYSYNPDEYTSLWNQELFDTPEYQIAEIEQGQAEKKKKSLAAEEKQLRKYNDIMLNVAEQTKGLGHKKVEDRGWNDPYNSVGAMERGIQTYDPDRVYSLITGGTEYQRWTAGWDNPSITNEYNYAMLMSDEEKNYYRYLYENEKYNEAAAFHQGLNDSGVLASRYAPIEAVRVKETAKQLPIASSIVSQGMMLADKYLAIPRTIAGWLGDESVKDPNSAWYGPAKENDLIQGAISEKLTEDFGGLAGKTYSNMMNSVRNLIGAFTSTGNKALDLFGFGAQVAQESTYKHLKDNEDYTIASIKGAVDGAFEVLEELLPYDTMLKNQGSIMRDIVRNGLAEFGEEATGAFVFNPIEESIFGENSLQDRKAEIYAAGGYYDGNEWVTLDRDKAKALKQAQVQAMREKTQQGIEQALGGLFGGTVGAVYGQVGQAAQTQNVGKRIQAANNTNEAGQSGLDQILQLAKGMKQTSQSFQMAQKIQEAAGETGKASNYQVGKLAQTIMQETGEAQQQVVRDTVQRAIRDRMTAQNVAAEKAEEYAKAIADNLLKGGRLSKEAQDLLAQDERAIETWKSFNSAVGQLGLSTAVYQATEQQRSIEDQISSLVGKTTRASSAVATEIEESIRNTNSTEEAIADFAKRMPNLMSESYAKLAQEVLKADKTAKEHKNFLDAAMKIRMAAFTLSKTVPASSLGKESAQKLYEAARKEFEEIDRQRIKNNRILKPGEGFAVFDGARFGTAEWKEKLKAIKNSNLRTQMEVLGETARRMGMQLRFVQEANKGIWGMENGASGEIVINLNAATRKGFAHSALVTMSHEMTHWLEHNSLEGYNQLREYILDNLRRKGYDVAGHIWQTIQNQYAVLSQDMTDEEAEAGKYSEELNLDMNGALADIVARSCENLLSSQKMALELARQNPGLYGRVSTFVKDFLTRMKEAVSSMPASLSYEAGLLVKETEKIADLWTKGFNETSLREGNEIDAGDMVIRYSLSQKPYASLRRQINNNKDKLAKMDPVANISGEIDYEVYREQGAKGINAARMMWATAIAKKFGTRYRKELGEYSIGKNRISKALAYIGKYNVGQTAAFEAIPDVVEKGLITEQSNDKMPNGERVESITFTAPVVIKGERGNMGVVMHRVQGKGVLEAYKVLCPDGTEFELSDKKETEVTLLRSWPLKNGLKHRGTSSASENTLLQNETKGKSLSVEQTENNEGVSTNPMVDDIDNIGNRKTPSTRKSIRRKAAEVNTDEQYRKAVERGDLETATAMLMDKLKRTEGIVPFMANNWDTGRARQVARMIKDPNMTEAIAQAAADMAKNVPDNAVLIPMPDRTGKVTDESSTAVLAKAISEITGRPVVYALEGAARESRYEAKAQGKLGASQEELGFRKVAEIPEGTFPLFVDNIVGKGVTADAARKAMGGGITLAYTKTLRSPGIEGLKNAVVTYDTKGNLIPLSQRIDISKRDIRYSMEQLDEEYEAARKAGDEDTMRRLVMEAARRAGYTDRVYHGTESFGFTRFDLDNSQDSIFVSYDTPDVASTYTKGDVRRINTAERPTDYASMDNAEIAEVLQKYREDSWVFGDYDSVEGTEDGGFRFTFTDDRNGKAYSTVETRESVIDALRMHDSNDSTQGIYEMFADPGNQLVIDLDGHRWDRIPWDVVVETLDYDVAAMRAHPEGSDVNTRQLAEFARYDGFDSVRINAIYDDGGRSGKGGINAGYGDVGIFFNSNAVKSADLVTYDDNGNVIPLSERFNTENPDIRYSMEQAPDMDVQAWMAGLTPGSLQTEDERALLQAWKDKRMSISLSIKRQLDYRAKIKRLENSADSLTPQEREDLVALRNKLQVQEEKQARMEKEMYQITSQEGFAGMMYQQNMVMRDFITGRTQDEINDTVDDMVHEVQRMAREIAATRKELEKLAEAEDLRNAQKALDGTDLNRNARRLKKDYRSRMTENEIQARLAEMALKLAAGGSMEDVAESARELAYDLGRLQNGYLGGAYGDLADRLKQVTIVIGKEQRDQLNAQHSSIPNLRRQLAGSGVRVVYDPELRGAGTLEDIGPGTEIHDLIPELGEDTGNMMNNLDVFVGLVQSTLKNLESEMLHDFDLDDAAMMIQGYALLASTELQGDPAMTTQVKRLLGLAKGEGGKAGELAERLKNAQDYLKGAIDKGEQAKGLTKMLRKDVDSAISYYNKTAAVAAKVEKQKVKEGLIAQLKSQHAQDLMKEQQKWRDLIEKDKTVRAMMQQNQELRRGITSDYTRIRKLLVNETDQKNIPEHMKSLARHMIRLLTENDLIGRKITNVQRQDLMETLRILDAMRQTDDDFTLDDLKMISDEEAQAAVAEALADLEDGIKFYNASPGSDRISNLQAFHNALDRVSEAVMTITGVIGAEQSVSFMGRRQLVADAAGAVRADLGRSRFKGELAGRGSKALRTGKRAVVYGNTTPVYFFKNLLNRGMDMIWKDMEWSENRNGLEMQRAKDFVGALAARTGYSSWSGQKMKVTLGGMAREIGIENVMEMCAIWKREHTTNPEMSQHLAKGGVYIAEDEEESGKPRHERKQQRAWRVTNEEVAAMMEMLTPEQKEYMEGMVGYLSNEMSELGNEASMRMYGIKKYKEKYYFPMKVWDGVKSARSDKGITGTDENRAAHRSWSKWRINRARNALVIGNFTTDAVNHIVEMITYNTMAPAIENINKVLNYQFEEGANQDESTKRNLRIMFQEAYGKDALDYLETFMKDLNGGTVQDQRKTLRDRMLSVFKKNAVAGSLSVALQQPLSYIRAAMMINPKYLAQALNPTYWKGSHAEMVKYSGVAVIKDMGRFDMNFGQSAKDYVTPEGAMSKGRAAYEWISNKTTILPELMDRMTWTRMWSAVKAEQKAQNPEMDPKSDEFLQKVAERFNEVMRRTQVYDSVMVKSSNMRSQRTSLKIMTSFMAEPTLTLNVLADAVRNVNQAGGKAMLAKAGGTFVLSAVVQAFVKAALSIGRSPDKKKTKEENLVNRFAQYLIGEVNPFSLIPGYSSIVETIRNGELKDDAMSTIGKMFVSIQGFGRLFDGEDGGDFYRELEDSVGQLAQLFSNVPAKNLMRDARAMFNWFAGGVYAERPMSAAVLKESVWSNIQTADTLTNALREKLFDAGYKTTNDAYYDRIWNARKSGDERAEEDLIEFMTAARGVGEKKITEEVNKRAKADESLSALEKAEYLNSDSYVMEQYKAGEIGREDAVRLLMQDRSATEDSVWWKLDRADFEKETGEKPSGNAVYYRLDKAIEDGASDAKIEQITKDMIEHGASEKEINKRLKSREDEAFDSYHAALKKGDLAAVEKAEQDLISQKLVTKSGLASKRKNYFINAFEEGEITRKQAEDGLKKFTDMAEDDVFWKIDKIDWMKSTGSNREPNDKYYRLDAAILNNSANEITRAVKDMRAHGFTKDGVDNCIQYFKKEYLNATGDRKIKLRDALTKAYKANGMTADQALRTIDSWKTSKKKKK